MTLIRHVLSEKKSSTLNGEEPHQTLSNEEAGMGTVAPAEDEFEVFRSDAVVNFRTLGWKRTTVIFLKIMFAIGVLSIPNALAALGAFPGAINIIGWCALNTYSGIIFGDFRNRHASCHSVADMAYVAGGPLLREFIGALFIIDWTILAAGAIVGVSIAFNALSEHAICTNYFTLVSVVIVVGMSTIRKFEHIGWLTYAGFASVYAAVLIVVIGVTLRDRPAIAPQTGPYELGYVVIGSPTFVQGINAASAIFVSSAGTTAFMPVISEMRNPREYRKPLYVCMFIVTASYLSFSLVVYRWCGTWVAVPSLGSAGPTLKKAAYGTAILGLIVTAALYSHVAAKYLFVRILRNSKHLQSNSAVHWGTWMACNLLLGAVAFVIAGGVPIFNYVLSLAACIGNAPLTTVLPAYLYTWDYSKYRTGSPFQQTKYWLHWLMFAIGMFLTVGGTYGVVQGIIDAYRDGTIGSAFSCADNSGTVEA
ncbi:Transmembrane amino acid transporter-like protein 12 [Elsinoe fawcettii]|nr:Transmembrane amino acid transporter-like protein 12 [Elsinoe fawcettii]